MIISRTPFRVSLFGGGSDYPKWYLQHGGAVFGFAINKYCYLSVRPLPPFFEYRNRIVYSKVEMVNEISEIEHPAVRGVLEDMGIKIGLEIHHDGDLPARSGLGSSSSFTVGLLNTLSAMNGKELNKKTLAQEALRIEQQVIKEHVGSQDQIWASYGGINRIEFLKNGDFEVQPAGISEARQKILLDHLLLFFTGFSRFAPEIAKKQIENLDKREKHLQAMTGLVDEALGVVKSDTRPITEIGEMLRETWRLKRELADNVSTPEIDEIYDAALEAGAIGGKLLGAGGGGFMLLFAKPENQPAVIEKLKGLIRVKFGIDDVGSKIVVFEPAGLENR
ncbi:MAG: kinase [Rhodospirillales bacterium]|nr:kinase [Rhodospirillales bacterium]